MINGLVSIIVILSVIILVIVNNAFSHAAKTGK
jgi:hypothetical protein